MRTGLSRVGTECLLRPEHLAAHLPTASLLHTCTPTVYTCKHLNAHVCAHIHTKDEQAVLPSSLIHHSQINLCLSSVVLN